MNASGPTRGVIAVIVGLSLYAALRSLLVPGFLHPALNAATGAALVPLALRCGMLPAELGLQRSGWRAGVRLGTKIAAATAVVIAAAAAFPATRDFFDDRRADVTGAALLWEVLVIIPLGTALLEEIVFRGVILGIAARHVSNLRAILVSAVFFGVWHVAPTLSTDGSNSATAGADGWELVLLVAGVVVAMIGAGVFLGALRVRSASLIAPFLAHSAANGAAFTAAWFVLRA